MKSALLILFLNAGHSRARAFPRPRPHLLPRLVRKIFLLALLVSDVCAFTSRNGAVLVYDITDEDSFAKVKNWVKELRKMLGDDICLVICGQFGFFFLSFLLFFFLLF